MVDELTVVERKIVSDLERIVDNVTAIAVQIVMLEARVRDLEAGAGRASGVALVHEDETYPADGEVDYAAISAAIASDDGKRARRQSYHEYIAARDMLEDDDGRLDGPDDDGE